MEHLAPDDADYVTSDANEQFELPNVKPYQELSEKEINMICCTYVIVTLYYNFELNEIFERMQSDSNGIFIHQRRKHVLNILLECNFKIFEKFSKNSSLIFDSVFQK